MEQASINQQWFEAMDNYPGEREMLFKLLDGNEGIESVIGGTFRQDTDRLHRHGGVAVATTKRILFLDKGLFGNSEVMAIAYPNIESITHSTGIFRAGVQVVGQGASSYRIEDIGDKEAVIEFVACVQRHLDELRVKQRDDLGGVSTVGQLAQLAGLLEKGLVTEDEFERLKRELLSL